MSMVCFNASLLHYWKKTSPMFSKIERGDMRAKREQVIKLFECFRMRMNCLLLSDEVKKKGMRLFLTHPHVYCCEPVIAASACASFSGEPMSNQRYAVSGM